MQLFDVTDVSTFARYGVKGPNAEKWLVGHGVKLPKSANSWVLHNNTLVLRLGSSEFVIEDQTGGVACTQLAEDSKRVTGVYKVPHADAAYLLAGSHATNILSELCELDLSEATLVDNTLGMTQVAGISATLLRQSLAGETIYRIWCDGTYGDYMRHILDEMTEEITA